MQEKVRDLCLTGHFGRRPRGSGEGAWARPRAKARAAGAKAPGKGAPSRVPGSSMGFRTGGGMGSWAVNGLSTVAQQAGAVEEEDVWITLGSM